jgi:hypothetical protein
MAIVQVHALTLGEATVFMGVWFNLLTAVRADLHELEAPAAMPIGLVGVHHLVQAGYASYEALMRVSGYGEHPDHMTNATLYEGYIAALPP